MMEPVAHIVIKPNGKRSVTLATQYDPMASSFWLNGERPEGYEVEPLVRLSDAEARIEELERELKREAQLATSMAEDRNDAEARAEAAEALLKEAREALEPFASGKHEMRNTHLLEWLTEGYGHCKRGSEDWAQSYLNSARDYIKAFEAEIRALKEKPRP